jgi:vacuolar-type H+-ATPase subunit E/Vma4
MAEQPSGFGTPPPGRDHGKADLREEAKEFASEAREGARSTMEQAKEQAARAAHEAETRTRSMIESQKGAAADSVHNVADALRKTAHQLDDQNQRMVGQLTNWAAEGLDRFSQSLRERDLGALLNQAEDVARRQPAVFIGGAVALGFVVSRFLKSSAERRRGYSSHSGAGYRGDTGYGSSGRGYRPEGGYAPSTGYDPMTGSYGSGSGRASGASGPASSRFAESGSDPLNPPPVGGV